MERKVFSADSACPHVHFLHSPSFYKGRTEKKKKILIQQFLVGYLNVIIFLILTQWTFLPSIQKRWFITHLMPTLLNS